MHTIRLGPPWVLTPSGTGARHSRKFGAPRALSAGESLWIVCANVPGAFAVSLNGTPLDSAPAAGPFAYDVTTLLRPRNEIAIEVASLESLGPVALEIRSPAV
jgi:hypothetical protein